MKLIAPEYYTKFHCIADKCRHSCCVGWEIAIDPDKLVYYRSIEGEFGARLQKGIAEADDAAQFILDDEERCPFLNRTGLCDMITALGEDALCQICRDHPRFRNFYADRTEIGLGLCCEAAGELILSQQEKLTLITLEDDGAADLPDIADESLLAWREELLRRTEASQSNCAPRKFCRRRGGRFPIIRGQNGRRFIWSWSVWSQAGQTAFWS